MHSQNVVARNLRLDHILVNEKGYPTLIGLNQAKFLNKPDELENIDELLSEYLAPEIVLRHETGKEADFYSLGAILYEMMTGKVSF